MQAREQKALTDSLHIQYGHHLFDQGDHEGAYSHFAMCSYANPVILLKLFPSLASETLIASLLPSLAGTQNQPNLKSQKSTAAPHS